VLITASGIFGEMQSALNTTWDVKPLDEPWMSLIRARAVSLGLVAALGFVTMVSLAASAALSVLGRELAMRTPVANVVLVVLNTVLSLAVFALLFAAIYKALPDKPLRWRDVGIGAIITAALFTTGKSLIGWYLGEAAPGSTYGAAGALIVVLLWAYYSTQIFLFGAELTKAIADARAAGADRTLADAASDAVPHRRADTCAC
jgi:membrane protein